MAQLPQTNNPELRRLRAHARRQANWKLWGNYLAERAWGTVREDYSHDGNAWTYFPHDDAVARSYRWNEDALAGLCDRQQFLCFGIALWNHKDPILKERLFGLSGPEGNHGEDVKEHYWYEDCTPTHSYASFRYHYPIDEFPYRQLREENAARGYTDREYELSDTGIMSDERFFDVRVIYAKAGPEDILVTLQIHNRSTEHARLSVIPQLWFRNTWSWGYPNGPMGFQWQAPQISAIDDQHIQASHPVLGNYHLYWQGKAELMLTNNETHRELVFNSKNRSPYVKDAFHRYIINGESKAINPEKTGTKAGIHHKLKLAPGAVKQLQLRLSSDELSRPFLGFKPIVDRRRTEADRYYAGIQAPALSDEARQIQRQALAGMLWSKQFYYYDVRQWLAGDPVHPVNRQHDRNSHWQHLHNFDIMSMPDKWEYPWYAVWDTAFHTLPLAMVDADYAKRQLTLITREWFMHPNGQLPAYEWEYGDVNPPVHAWATLSVYKMDQAVQGKADKAFLEGIFHKLLLNFTWWVNRKDSQGNSIFEGGFLGLDNISLFDRSLAPPMGGVLNQSDGTAWMGFYCQSMLDIALTLATDNSVYEAMAGKFVEHYLLIGDAINGNTRSQGLWDAEDGFYYDRLDLPDGRKTPLKIRSLVGLMPLIAVSIVEDDSRHRHVNFNERFSWILETYPQLARLVTRSNHQDSSRLLLSFLDSQQLRSVLAYLLDEDEFLSDYGIRSLSRFHAQNPFEWNTDKGQTLSIAYEPGEGETDLFGGNSNWRGPVWFPINYLLIEALGRYHSFLGDEFKVECPTGSGTMMNLGEVATHLSHRLIRLFQADADGKRPWCGDNKDYLAAANDGLHLFFEYFNGDTGEGLGASHQTGWTGLVALLQQQNASIT